MHCHVMAVITSEFGSISLQLPPLIVGIRLNRRHFIKQYDIVGVPEGSRRVGSQSATNSLINTTECGGLEEHGSTLFIIWASVHKTLPSSFTKKIQTETMKRKNTPCRERWTTWKQKLSLTLQVCFSAAHDTWRITTFSSLCFSLNDFCKSYVNKTIFQKRSDDYKVSNSYNIPQPLKVLHGFHIKV